MRSLTSAEQDALARIIEVLYGYDSQIISLKKQFNVKTAEVVETAMQAMATCNDTMKKLLADLAGGGKILARGWLRKTLRAAEQKLTDEKLQLNGLGCRVSAARNWKTEIVMSTYGL